MDGKEELLATVRKFASSGWDLIEEPAKAYLDGDGSKDALVQAVAQADAECGSCGCEFDALYKSFLESTELL